MSRFDDYRERYTTIRMERRGGILQIAFHTDGGPLRWGKVPHGEFPRAFQEIAADPDNRVVIMTGTGDEFSGPKATEGSWPAKTATEWDWTVRQEMHMSMNLLGIEVPMIGVINGPALRHPELPLLCDIVLAAEHATIMDSGHFAIGAVPGDPVHAVFPLLMGLNRARYFLLTGQVLGAAEAKDLGLVNEVLPRDRLLPRAWELAEGMAKRNPLLLRYSRILLTHHLKAHIHATLGYGLALSGLVQSEKDSWRDRDS